MLKHPAPLWPSETGLEDQALETDVMRFMAIIGIIFWLLFAVVRHFPDASSDAGQEVHHEPPAPSVILDRPMPVPSPEDSVVEMTPPMPAPSAIPAQAAHVPQKTHAPPSATKDGAPGVSIQFDSLTELHELMHNARVRVFSRFISPGFDLLFEAHGRQGAVQFIRRDRMPDFLWRVQGPTEQAYFTDRLLHAQPALGGFGERQVLVAFEDKALEEEITQTMAHLLAEDRSGVLSIDGQGQVFFYDAVSAPPVSTSGDWRGGDH